MRRKKYFIIMSVLFLWGGITQGIFPNASYAQFVSKMTPDGTMGTQVTQSGKVYDINGGTIKGSNQFHSFGQFSVGTGDTASFNGPSVIANILSRITGGQQSMIDGILKSTIFGANLYLLNPSGVLFGPNASLDVSGSFHVSTADYLKMTDGAKFYADLAKSTVLTTAPVGAFGFLTNTPAPIFIQGSQLNVQSGKGLSVVGGDIQITSDALLKAPHGQINIASVASPGEVIPNIPGQLPALDVSSFATLGQITESGSKGGSNVTVSSTAGAGIILIRGGRLVMDNAQLNANTTGYVAGNALGIGVQLTGDLVLTNNAQVLTYSGVGRAGDIRIKADSMEIRGGAFIYSYCSYGGNSGNIEVTGNSLKVIDGGSQIRTGTYGSGNSGKLEIRADDIIISGGAAGAGIVGSFTNGQGNSGDVRVTAKNLQILNQSEISSAAFSNGSGNVGTIEVSADRVFISGSTNPGIYTGIFANTFGVGKGGNLNLTANSLEMTNHASLQACTFGRGDAGKITLRVGSLDMKDASYVSTTGYYGTGLGNSGNIEVTANRVSVSGLDNATQPFGADATGFFTGSRDGHGGDINITTDSLTLTNRGLISATSYGSGRGGNIGINAGSMEVMNGAFIIASAFGSGNAGKIEIIADSLLISGVHPDLVSDINGNISPTVSGIASQSALNGGNAGDVRISTGTLQVLDGARISTQTFGAGNGGNIEVTANNAVISGTNAVFRDFFIGKGIDAKEASKLASSGILADANSSYLGDRATGNSGNVFIQANNLQLTDQGLISTRTTGPGAGGNIELTTGQTTLSSGGLISAESSVSAKAGKAGDILIKASDLFQSDSSSVTTAAEHAQGGNITIQAGEVQLTNGALVSAESSGKGNAGNIYIATPDTLLLKNSSVTTEAKQADGGNIQVQAQYLVNLIDSKITASVGGGPQTVGGNITIDPHYVILNDSQVIANAYEGKGGNIRIVADVFLASPESFVSASSALGIDGTVDIRAPITNLSGTLAPLKENFLSTAALFRDPCLARIHGGQSSSFIISGRSGLPAGPGTVLPSPIY